MQVLDNRINFALIIIVFSLVYIFAIINRTLFFYILFSLLYTIILIRWFLIQIDIKLQFIIKLFFLLKLPSLVLITFINKHRSHLRLSNWFVLAILEKLYFLVRYLSHFRALPIFNIFIRRFIVLDTTLNFFSLFFLCFKFGF